MATFHVISMLLLSSLIVFAYIYDNRVQKLLPVQKLLRKTSRIVPFSTPQICSQNKTKMRMVCVLEEKGVYKNIYMREANL